MALIDMLPSYFKNSPEAMEIQNALNKQVERLFSTRDDLFNQLNVETATWGLSIWEKALGLPTDILKSYDFRRSRIDSKLRSQGVTTKEMIKNVAESFSNGEVEVIEHPAEYTFDVKFTGTLGIPPNMDDLTSAIEEIKPAHLLYRYIIMYLTHAQMHLFTHEQLSKYTYLQIRNGEALKDGN